jgi:hypothetical protein
MKMVMELRKLSITGTTTTRGNPQKNRQHAVEEKVIYFSQ